ncbi:MAG: hypothetical protein NTZ09_15290 [Candidatus Hydrogenedentes bacterium]|nr:hypothetical protein [Candidatus Hydrogenedentota bacterium]
MKSETIGTIGTIGTIEAAGTPLLRENSGELGEVESDDFESVESADGFVAGAVCE